MELGYTFRQIDNYLQEQLKYDYPFKQTNPKRQKLCSWFEIPDTVLAAAYGRTGGMFARKALTGGRGLWTFFRRSTRLCRKATKLRLGHC